MKRHMLLTGPIGCGKSTLIYETIGEQLKTAGGFCTSRLLDSKGKTLGFRQMPAGELNSLSEYYKESMSGIFIYCQQSGMKLDNEVLLESTLPLIKKIEEYPFGVLDEIGGCELMLPEFRDTLYDTLRKSTPCIGVLKSEENSLNMVKNGRLPETYCNEYKSFMDFIYSNSDVEVVPTTRETIDDVRGKILQWMDENIRRI